MALGHTAEGGEIIECNVPPLQTNLIRSHTVSGLQNNLDSVSQLVNTGYVSIFDGQRVGIYDSYSTKIKVLRATVLEGWSVPHKKLWRIPLVMGVRHRNNNLETVLTKRSPLEILAKAAPPIDHILSVYKLKTRPELVRYYHTAAGFPTEPTWTKAIQNVHYASWPDVTAAVAARHFPESNDTW